MRAARGAADDSAAAAEPTRTVLLFSGGKDSAWCLWRLSRHPRIRVTALLTTFDDSTGRVPIHDLRIELVQAQADAAGLPLRLLPLVWPCSNEQYQARLGEVLAAEREQGVEAVAFGDLFLREIRAYRERLLRPLGLRALFPLWRPTGGTAALAERMLAAGLRATVTSVDPARVPADLLGRTYDRALLEALPPEVDPCGENGEFHTFCHGGGCFRRPVAFGVGARRTRDGMLSLDLLPG